MKELNNFLRILEKRPLMYIGEHNIHYLSMLISGYMVGKNNDYNEFVKFQFWVMEYLDLPKKSVGWAKVIDCYSASQKEAIECFFKLYKKWHKEEFGEDAW